MNEPDKVESTAHVATNHGATKCKATKCEAIGYLAVLIPSEICREILVNKDAVVINERIKMCITFITPASVLTRDT